MTVLAMCAASLAQSARNDKPGSYILRLGVRDNRTGLIGTVTGKINVPAQEASQKPVQQN